VWWSWRIATGLGVIGATLKRDIFFEYAEAGRIWPNLSAMLIGESGDGKNTVIQPAEYVMRQAGVNMIHGKTMEAMKHSLMKLSDEVTKKPSVGFIAAKELAEFLGLKDYQGGIMEALTALLDNGDEVDITTRSGQRESAGKPQLIYYPTLTMFAGSTAEWLQTKMPEGTLEGGFLGRFLVAAENGKKIDQGILPVPNPARYESLHQKHRVMIGKQTFLERVCALPAWIYDQTKGALPYKMTGHPEAEEYYDNWYCNRFSRFGPAIRAYANRSASVMRRVAMLSAISRGSLVIHETDYIFADVLFGRMAAAIEESIINMSREVRIGNLIMKMLPCKRSKVISELSAKHTSVWVNRAMVWLVEADRATVENRDGSLWLLKKEEVN